MIIETANKRNKTMMTNQKAIEYGYTVLAYASSDEHDLTLLIRPDTDTEDRFKAWCMDEHEFLNINGWMFDIEIKKIG